MRSTCKLALDMAFVFVLAVFVVGSGAQKLVAFDDATASSAYSSKSFAADLATAESSGCAFDAGLLWREAGNCFGCARYWCSAGWA